MALPMMGNFPSMLALTIASSTVYTSAQILADAAVMAASTHVGCVARENMLPRNWGGRGLG